MIFSRAGLPSSLVVALVGGYAGAQVEEGAGGTEKAEEQGPEVPEAVVNTSSGMTLGSEVVFEDEPHFRIRSTELVDGRPKFDYFLYVKAKLNGVYDISGGLQEEDTFNVGKIDVWGNDDSNRFGMDMNQSQIRFRGQNETGEGPVIGYLEGDFWGEGKGFRLRHLWLEYQFIHVGQDWTFFGDKEIWPNVFDWDGPPSGVWRREPEVRLMFDGSDGWRYECGLGNPGAEVTVNEEIDPSVSLAYQSVPDFIGAINKMTDFGHLRATAIYRNLEYETSGTNHSVPGFGATLSGYIGTGQDGRNPIQFQVAGGQGIATYLVSFSGLGYDALPDGDGNLKAIPAFGGWASYEHWFSKKWHANLVGGYSLFDSNRIDSYTIPGPGYTATNSDIRATYYYGLVNVMYDWLPNFTVGLEYNLGRKEVQHSGQIDTGSGVVNELDKGRTAQRISFGAFFNF